MDAGHVRRRPYQLATAAHRHRPILAREPGPLHLGRLLEPVNLDFSFGLLRHAVKRRGPDRDRDRLLIGQPAVCRQRGLQGGVANCDCSLVRPCFAGSVGHVDVHEVAKAWLVLLRHGQVGAGDEANREFSIQFRGGTAMGYLL